jgi:hypothetical protein
VTKVQLLALEYGATINVDLNPARQAELRLKPGDNVYVYPQKVRVFVPDYDKTLDYSI